MLMGFLLHNYWELYRTAQSFEYLIVIGITMITSLLIYLLSNTNSPSTSMPVTHGLPQKSQESSSDIITVHIIILWAILQMMGAGILPWYLYFQAKDFGFEYSPLAFLFFPFLSLFFRFIGK